jgi:hypothetical protein
MAVVLSGGMALAETSAPSAGWTAAEQDGKINATLGDRLMFAWQAKPLVNPTGGEKFQSSAFLHPLRTPSGFEWTCIQPADHLHHFGLWWPWKYIEVEGAKYNCWEIQEGQGAHVARTVKSLSGGTDGQVWEFINETVVKKPGTSPLAVIREVALVGVAVKGDAQVLDISLRQKSTGSAVTIVNYRYSGFSWRGPTSWDKDNSTLVTSDGKGREDSNGTPVRWVMVSGPTADGTATVLMMSAAADLAGTPERVRVWDSKNHKGTPFVNFNPVMQAALPLDDAHPAVSNRKYRVIAADHTLDAAAAEAAWREWMGK